MMGLVGEVSSLLRKPFSLLLFSNGENNNIRMLLCDVAATSVSLNLVDGQIDDYSKPFNLGILVFSYSITEFELVVLGLRIKYNKNNYDILNPNL
jgi:hypothetical protein